MLIVTKDGYSKQIPVSPAGERSIGIFAKRDIAAAEELTYHYLVRRCVLGAINNQPVFWFP